MAWIGIKSRILAYLLYALMGLVSLPPLSWLYLLSPLLSWVMQRILKYRRAIIRLNLSKSFPEKSGKDLLQLEKEYYNWLSRLFIESVKTMHWSARRLEKQIELENPELLQDLANQGKDLVILTGHTGNWEWSPYCLTSMGYQVLGVYKPQSSATFDFLTRMIRTKKQVQPIPMKATLRALHEQKKVDSSPRALLLIADQIPAKGDIHFWEDFLNQPTAWFTGGEKLAFRFDLPVFYLKMNQRKKGRYAASFLPLYEGGQKPEEGEITRFYIHALEHTIKEQPAHWLWSHRRWKHQPEDLSL